MSTGRTLGGSVGGRERLQCFLRRSTSCWTSWRPSPITLAMQAGAPRTPFEYLAFSVASLATMSFVRTEPASALGVFLASAEGIIGVALVALFMYTLGRRMSGN